MKTTSVSTTKTSVRPVQSVKGTAKSSIDRAVQSTSPQELSPEFLPDLTAVSVSDTMVVCAFDDGHTVSFPLQWSAKLSRATTSQQQAFDFNAHFIFWDEIDEIIGVRNVLLRKQLNWQ
jgi:Protein of unknown function (DUF2442)